MSEIIIENEQTLFAVDADLLNIIQKVALKALEVEKFAQPCEVSVLLVDNQEMHRLNHQFRDMDKPTDVLSFSMIEGGYDERDIAYVSDLLLLGDIVISLERANEQAQSYGHTFEREVAFLTAHAMLHLLGYDHLTDTQEQDMMQKQEAILNELGFLR
ncbi:MAG: rRNA maturation RNase YbeY [Hyphomonadaceae bacterium]|nr:rRNA maturation RNase YbeY [Clostridia bacterium]